MKTLTLTHSIIASLLLSSFFASGETMTHLRSLISAKEIELSRVQNELISLKEKLSSKTISPSTAETTYKVKAGDTISSIARRHKMSYSELINLNSLSEPSKIVIGQELNIEAIPHPYQQTKKTASISQNQPHPKKETHLVKQGETFYRVAMANSISVSDLKKLNPGVDSDRIFVGQILKITGAPAAPTATRQHAAMISKSKKNLSSTDKPAPKKSSTPALTRSATSNEQAFEPVSSRKGTDLKSFTMKKDAASTPSPPTKKKAAAPELSKKVSSIILTNETSFSDFAAKYNTDTNSLNALNGWNLPKATLLARGSEIYIPK